MKKVKLQVLLVPLQFAVVPTDLLDNIHIKRFLHLAHPSCDLNKVQEDVQVRYKKLYPDEQELSIERFQDNDLCDLDLDYPIEDVFNPGDILRVIVYNDFVNQYMEASFVPKRIEYHPTQDSYPSDTSHVQSFQLQDQFHSHPDPHNQSQNHSTPQPKQPSYSPPGSQTYLPALPNPLSETQSTPLPAPIQSLPESGSTSVSAPPKSKSLPNPIRRLPPKKPTKKSSLSPAPPKPKTVTTVPQMHSKSQEESPKAPPAPILADNLNARSSNRENDYFELYNGKIPDKKENPSFTPKKKPENQIPSSKIVLVHIDSNLSLPPPEDNFVNHIPVKSYHDDAASKSITSGMLSIPESMPIANENINANRVKSAKNGDENNVNIEMNQSRNRNIHPEELTSVSDDDSDGSFVDDKAIKVRELLTNKNQLVTSQAHDFVKPVSSDSSSSSDDEEKHEAARYEKTLKHDLISKDEIIDIFKHSIARGNKENSLYAKDKNPILGTLSIDMVDAPKPSEYFGTRSSRKTTSNHNSSSHENKSHSSVSRKISKSVSNSISSKISQRTSLVKREASSHEPNSRETITNLDRVFEKMKRFESKLNSLIIPGEEFLRKIGYAQYHDSDEESDQLLISPRVHLQSHLPGFPGNHQHSISIENVSLSSSSIGASNNPDDSVVLTADTPASLKLMEDSRKSDDGLTLLDRKNAGIESSNLDPQIQNGKTITSVSNNHEKAVDTARVSDGSSTSMVLPASDMISTTNNFKDDADPILIDGTSSDSTNERTQVKKKKSAKSSGTKPPKESTSAAKIKASNDSSSKEKKKNGTANTSEDGRVSKKSDSSKMNKNLLSKEKKITSTSKASDKPILKEVKNLLPFKSSKPSPAFNISDGIIRDFEKNTNVHAAKVAKKHEQTQARTTSNYTTPKQATSKSILEYAANLSRAISDDRRNSSNSQNPRTPQVSTVRNTAKKLNLHLSTQKTFAAPIAKVTPNKRKFNASDSDSSDDSDSDLEANETKKPRLVASVPTRRSQSPATPMVNYRTPSLTKPSIAYSASTSPQKKVQSPTLNSSAKSQPTVTVPSFIRKPLLTSLDDLALRGVPAVMDNNKFEKKSISMKEAATKDEESSSSSSEESSSDSSDDDNDVDATNSKFLNLKTASAKKSKKKLNIFSTLKR